MQVKQQQQQKNKLRKDFQVLDQVLILIVFFIFAVFESLVLFIFKSMCCNLEA